MPRPRTPAQIAARKALDEQLKGRYYAIKFKDGTRHVWNARVQTPKEAAVMLSPNGAQPGMQWADLGTESPASNGMLEAIEAGDLLILWTDF